MKDEISYVAEINILPNVNKITGDNMYSWVIYKKVYYPEEDHEDQTVVSHGKAYSLEKAMKDAYNSAKLLNHNEMYSK